MSSHSHAYKLLAARLAAMQADIARQSRLRPLARVPDETLRLVKRLLADLRRFIASIGRSRPLPTLPSGAMRFSALSLFLGEARVKFEAYGALFQFDRPAPGSVAAMLEGAETDLASMISASAADIRNLRERRDARKRREQEDDRQASGGRW